MNNKIKVSVIVPAYNVEDYIESCLESVLNQDFRDYEIIIIDDGSTDNTYKKILKYEEKFDCIKIIKQANKGLSAARNIGIKEAKGEFLYFLDSDDLIKAIMLSTCYNYSLKNNADIVTFDAQSFYDKNFSGEKAKQRFNYDRSNILNEGIFESKKFLIESLKNVAYKASVCLLFIKREIITSNNLFFYEGIVHEDELFTLELILKSKNIAYINLKLFLRRVRDNSTMTSKKDISNIDGYITVATELKKIEINDGQLKYLIDQKIMDLCSAAILIYNNIESDKNNLIKLKIKKTISGCKLSKSKIKLILNLKIPAMFKIIRFFRRRILNIFRRNHKIKDK